MNLDGLDGLTLKDAMRTYLVAHAARTVTIAELYEVFEKQCQKSVRCTVALLARERVPREFVRRVARGVYQGIQA